MAQVAFKTKLTELLSIKVPLVCPPMAGATGGALAASAVLAGGFGFIGTGYVSPDVLKRELDTARIALGLAVDKPLPLGVGYLAWTLDLDPNAAKLLHLAFENHVRAIWLAFGDHIGRWIEVIQKHNEEHKNHKHPRILIFVVVSTVGEARRAMDEWHADAIVAQGIEAGGHGLSTAPPLFTLLPDVIRELGPNCTVPILGAGGLTHGSHLAALLTLGASGIVIGTRFLATPECIWIESQKSVLISAPSADATARSGAWDHARGIAGWPKGIDGRGLKNKTWSDCAEGVPPEELKKRYDASVAAGDPNTMVVWAGTGVGAVNKIMNAKDIVVEVAEEARQLLHNAASLVH